jgi:hypothetical protein
MKTKIVLGTVALAFSFATCANAGLVRRSFDITATDFILEFGSETTPPVDPVTLDFTLTWDPAVLTSGTTTGLNVTSFNLPYSSEFSYSADNYLTVGTDVNFDSYSVFTDSYGVFINDPFGASPIVYALGYADSTDSYWVSQQTSLSAGAIGAVPEPATWAMMLVGFAGLGFAAYGASRRSVALAA